MWWSMSVCGVLSSHGHHHLPRSYLRFRKMTASSHAIKPSRDRTRFRVRLCGLSRNDELIRNSDPKILDHPQQHPRPRIRIRELNMLVGVMADAAAAGDQDHSHIGDVDHGHAVMASSAREFEWRNAFGGDGVGYLGLEP